MTVEQIFGMDQSVISEDNLELAFGGLLEGACLGYLEECRVVPFVGMVVTVGRGVLAVGGVFIFSGAASVATLAAADPALPRIDRVVARRDNAANSISVVAKTGTPAANPVPPSLTRAGGIYEISLAQVRVAAGDVSISANEIIDERGSPAVCGYMTFKAREHQMRGMVEGWRQRGSWSARASAAALTAMDGQGLYAATTNFDNSRAVVQDADGVALQQDTSAVLGNDAYVYTASIGGVQVHRRSYSPLFECKFKLAQTTAERVMIGLSSSATAASSDDPIGHYACLQYSTSRADANFMLFTKDNVTQNLIDSGVPVDTVAHTIRILMDSSSVVFELLDTNRNIQARVRATVNLPGVTTDIGPTSAIRTLAAAVKSIYQYYAEGINRNI